MANKQRITPNPQLSVHDVSDNACLKTRTRKGARWKSLLAEVGKQYAAKRWILFTLKG